MVSGEPWELIKVAKSLPSSRFHLLCGSTRRVEPPVSKSSCPAGLELFRILQAAVRVLGGLILTRNLSRRHRDHGVEVSESPSDQFTKFPSSIRAGFLAGIWL